MNVADRVSFAGSRELARGLERISLDHREALGKRTRERLGEHGLLVGKIIERRVRLSPFVPVGERRDRGDRDEHPDDEGETRFDDLRDRTWRRWSDSFEGRDDSRSPLIVVAL